MDLPDRRQLFDAARSVDESRFAAIFAADGSFGRSDRRRGRKMGAFAVTDLRNDQLHCEEMSGVSSSTPAELQAFCLAVDLASDVEGETLVVTDDLELAYIGALSKADRWEALLSRADHQLPARHERLSVLTRWPDSLTVVHIKGHRGYDHSSRVEVLHAAADRAAQHMMRGIFTEAPSLRGFLRSALDVDWVDEAAA